MKIASILTCVLCLCASQTIFDEELYNNVLDEGLCTRQLENMDKLKFYDSSFSVPQGLLGGNLRSYGNFHECLGIKQEFGGEHIEGKYCLIRGFVTPPTFRIPLLGGVSDSNNLTWMELTLNSPETKKIETFISSAANSRNPVVQTVTLHLGLCVPKTCTVDAVLRPYVEHPLIRFNYSEEICRLPGDKPFFAADYTGLVIFFIIGLLTLMSTAYELGYVFLFDKDAAKASELLRAFSLYSNTSRLFSFVKTTRSLDCLNGIRAISVLWIIIFHTAIVTIKNSSNKLEIVQAVDEKKDMLWIFIATLGVDSFFVLSGLLLVYTFLAKNKELTWSSLPQFYWNRYTRLFPLLAATVLLQASVMHRVVDGPRAPLVLNVVGNCRKYWWSTLLHMQNIVNPTVWCLMPLWYLSVDMQLYLVSPLVLCWVLRSPRAAWTALAAGVASSLAGALAFCFYFNFNKPHFGIGNDDPTYEFDVWYYQNTVVRSPPFFIGMLFGYILHVYSKKNLTLPKWIVFSCYSISIVLLFVAIFGEMMLGNNQVGINIHTALFRSCWALPLCWLILACAHGYGGPVNWFLSLKLWQFLARISYAMYLFSPVIQYSLLCAGVQHYFNTQTLVSAFAVDIVFTLALSVAMVLLVEMPFATLFKLLQNRT